MKIKIFYLLAIFCIALGLGACSNLNKCGILFHIRDSEESVLTYLNSNNVEYRLEKSSYNRILRIKRLNHDGLEFNTIRLIMVDNKIIGGEYRAHSEYYVDGSYRQDNISNVINHLTKKYGNYKTNPNWKKGSQLCKYFWGKANSNYILVEECSDTYSKIYFMNGVEELKQVGAYSLYNKMMTDE